MTHIKNNANETLYLKLNIWKDKYLKYKKKYIDLKNLIGGTLKELLIVCSSENRKLNEDEYDPEMPGLLDGYGLPSKEISDFTRYKEEILEIIGGENINYTSVDPTYTNEKIGIDDDRYRGHISSFMNELPDSKQYDYIFITSCYDNFFKENIEKIKKILKPSGKIIILKVASFDSFDVLFKNNFNKIYENDNINMYQILY